MFQAYRWCLKFTKNREEEAEHAHKAVYKQPEEGENGKSVVHNLFSSAARTQACSPPLLLLLLWDVARLRGRRLEVEGRGDGVIDMQSMQIRRPHESARAAFSKETGFQKSAFAGSMWTIGQIDAKHKSVSMWTDPDRSEDEDFTLIPGLTRKVSLF